MGRLPVLDTGVDGTGSGRVVEEDFQQPDVRLDLTPGGTAGDYDGLDRFGRVKDLLWYDHGTPSADVVRIKHGYDYASNRTWREDSVAAANSKDLDELYTYDGLQQLTAIERGNLDFSNPADPVIQSKTFARQWGLEPLGNWADFDQAGPGDIRLAFAMFEGKPTCILYDYHVQGVDQGLAFSSPVRTLRIDRVVVIAEAKIAVTRSAGSYCLEAAVPLEPNLWGMFVFER